MESAAEYVALAVRLGRDASFRAAVMARMRLAGQSIFEHSQYIREWESFMVRAVRVAPPLHSLSALSSKDEFLPIPPRLSSSFLDSLPDDGFQSCQEGTVSHHPDVDTSIIGNGLTGMSPVSSKLPQTSAKNRPLVAVDALPVSITEIVVKAHSHHDAGRLADAETLYRRALLLLTTFSVLPEKGAHRFFKVDPMMPLPSGHSGGLWPQPADAGLHNDLGAALQQQRRLLEAEAQFRLALRLRPDFLRAMNNLGVTLVSAGKLIEAELVYRKALISHPGNSYSVIFEYI